MTNTTLGYCTSCICYAATIAVGLISVNSTDDLQNYYFIFFFFRWTLFILVVFFISCPSTCLVRLTIDPVPSTRLAAASDNDYQLLAHDWWFSPGTSASYTTKTGRHDIAEILLKVALKHQKSNQIKSS